MGDLQIKFAAFVELILNFVIFDILQQICLKQEDKRKTLLCNRGESFHTSVFMRSDLLFCFFFYIFTGFINDEFYNMIHIEIYINSILQNKLNPS